MMSSFLKIILSAGLLLSSSVIAVTQEAETQETANIPANIIITAQSTVNSCEIGAGEVGTCVNPTQGYMDGLLAQALPDEQFSQLLADYVIALTALAQADDACNIIDIEIAESIKLAASYALDPEQQLALATIGETIGSCEDFQTAAIAPVASPN